MRDRDLARILAQPGYSISGDSASQAATPRRKGKEGTEGHKGTNTTSAPFLRSPWRSERQFMAAVIAECDRRAIEQPEYGLIYHIPNENAHRNPGVRGGVPDLCLPVAAGKYHSLYIELKVGGGKLSKAQTDMILKLDCEGHRVAVVVDSVEGVMNIIEEYLSQ